MDIITTTTRSSWWGSGGRREEPREVYDERELLVRGVEILNSNKETVGTARCALCLLVLPDLYHHHHIKYSENVFFILLYNIQ